MEENLIVTLKEASIFQQKSLILDKVNLKIHKGEFAYLIGKTGSEKIEFIKNFIWCASTTKRKRQDRQDLI